MKKKILPVLLLSFLSLIFTENQAFSRRKITHQPSYLKSLSGSLFFHRYSTYEALDGKIFMLDIESLKLVELSKDWNIISPMNPHISNNSKYLTFMGLRPSDKKWSVFLWNFDKLKKPENITNDQFYRNEDPKFSYDSQDIIFKCDGGLCRYNIESKEIKKILTYHKEASMPYWHPEKKGIIFSSGARSQADIDFLDLSTGHVKPLNNKIDLQEYYPIFLNRNKYYYTRWISQTKPYDQIYLGFLNGREPRRLPFNTEKTNSSDPCPINRSYLFFSRHDPTTKEGYNLHLANRWNASTYKLPIHVNSKLEELGCSYSRYRFLDLL